MNDFDVGTCDTDSDSEDELLCILGYRDSRKIIRIRHFIEKVVAHYNEEDFRQNFRLPVPAFERLYSDIFELWQPTQKHYGRKEVDLKKQILAVLWLLATQDSYRYSLCF